MGFCLQRSNEDKYDIKLGLYVDDLFVIAQTKSRIKHLKHDVEIRYDKIKVSYGASINFLGMKFTFEEARIKVSIDIHELVQGTRGIKGTSAGMNLFVLNEDENPRDRRITRW